MRKYIYKNVGQINASRNSRYDVEISLDDAFCGDKRGQITRGGRDFSPACSRKCVRSGPRVIMTNKMKP